MKQDKKPHLIVLRHGQSDHNVQERYNSNPQHPAYFISHLTERGKMQIHQIGEQLLAQGLDCATIKKAYVSPLPRAIETAQLLADMGVIPEHFSIDARLIEVNMGDREGKKYSEFPEDPWDHTKGHLYHGETDDDVAQRTRALLHEVRAQYPQDIIMFITHGTPVLTFLELCTHQKRHSVDVAACMIFDC